MPPRSRPRRRRWPAPAGGHGGTPRLRTTPRCRRCCAAWLRPWASITTPSHSRSASTARSIASICSPVARPVAPWWRTTIRPDRCGVVGGPPRRSPAARAARPSPGRSATSSTSASAQPGQGRQHQSAAVAVELASGARGDPAPHRQPSPQPRQAQRRRRVQRQVVGVLVGRRQRAVVAGVGEEAVEARPRSPGASAAADAAAAPQVDARDHGGRPLAVGHAGAPRVDQRRPPSRPRRSRRRPRDDAATVRSRRPTQAAAHSRRPRPPARPATASPPSPAPTTTSPATTGGDVVPTPGHRRRTGQQEPRQDVVGRHGRPDLLLDARRRRTGRPGTRPPPPRRTWRPRPPASTTAPTASAGRPSPDTAPRARTPVPPRPPRTSRPPPTRPIPRSTCTTRAAPPAPASPVTTTVRHRRPGDHAPRRRTVQAGTELARRAARRCPPRRTRTPAARCHHHSSPVGWPVTPRASKPGPVPPATPGRPRSALPTSATRHGPRRRVAPGQPSRIAARSARVRSPEVGGDAVQLRDDVALHRVVHDVVAVGACARGAPGPRGSTWVARTTRPGRAGGRPHGS